MTKKIEKGPNDLQQEILNQNLCCGCGACENICPYIDVVRGESIFVGECDQDVGDCYRFCPMTMVDVPFLESEVFGSQRDDASLGYYKSVRKARSSSSQVREEAQYGGLVTSLVSFLLEEDVADGFILTKSEDSWGSSPELVKDPERVIEFTKSKYVSSPNISKLNEIKEEDGKIGLVGTPCQITAARKMEIYDDFEFGPLIGLFCTWALNYDFLDYVSEIVEIEKVKKFDIPPPPAEKLLVYLPDEVKEIPLEDVKEYMMSSCNTCVDMTSEFADVSIGQVEGDPDWNTIIVRSDEGEEIFEKASKADVIEVEDLEKERLDHLREASGKRKKRVFKEFSEEEMNVTMCEEDEEAIKEVEL